MAPSRDSSKVQLPLAVKTTLPLERLPLILRRSVMLLFLWLSVSFLPTFSVCPNSILPACWAQEAPAERLRKALVSAKILDDDNSFTVAINASEAVISTYESGKSANPDNQCKMLALLFGKTAFETNDKLAKIKACFYAKDQNSYRQVVVTVGDVEAFGSGRVDKDKTLNALELIVHQQGAKTPAKNEEYKTNAPSAINRANLQTLKRSGIAFYYPMRWSLGEMKGDGYICQLSTNGKNGWSIVQMRLQDLDSPEQAARYDVSYWRTHGKETLNSKSLVIGHQNDFTAFSVVARDTTNKSRFEKHVYFGDKHQIYSLTLAFNEKDFNELEPDFETMLATVMYAR
jgi:hypothetical protein